MRKFFILVKSLAPLTRWLRRWAAEFKDKGSIPAAVAAFQMEAKGKNSTCVEISAHVKDPRVVKINPEPSTAARFIACLR